MVGSGPPLVKTVGLRPIYLEVILEHGLVFGDASSVKCWLEVIIGGLSDRKDFDLLEAHLEREHSGKLHADRANASRARLAWLRRRGIAARFARYGVESRERLGRWRWVVERTPR